MTPHKGHGLTKNLCPKASKGCAAACLYTAGRGSFSNVKAAREKKARFYIQHTEEFLEILYKELKKLKAGSVVRLNGTTDICWERHGVPQSFPELTFYDYTKIPNRKVPKNYHLTFSRSESNDSEVLSEMSRGTNVAIVFKERPKKWMGRRVIDGDKHDFRFLDPKGIIVGLTAKGKARYDTSNFVL